jgi:peptide/nickel transport system ATP-binding protein
VSGPGDGLGRAERSRGLLEVEDLRVRFDGGGPAAVDGVSFAISPGEIRGLVGESGSGKSVTGLTLMGLTRELGAEVSGRALLAGEIDLVAAGEEVMRRVRGARVAMIFQDPLSSLNPFHRVGDQVAEAILVHDPARGKGAAHERAVELLEEVGIPDPGRRARDYPHQFSGGMRQRVMIAMALANEPELLIADEPTTALDVTTQAQILDLIVRLRDSHGMAVLLVSHDLGVIAERADSVTVMRAGRVVEFGGVSQVFERPSAGYTQELLAAVPRVDQSPPVRRQTPAESPLIEVEDLSLTFPGRSGFWGRGGEDVRAVDGVSLTVPTGSTLGIVGESGSGKSTLCRLMLRLLDPDTGSVRFAGRDITGLGPREMRRLRGSMQMVFQDPYSSLNPRHRVGSIIAEPIRLHGEVGRAEVERRVDELLERVGLGAVVKDRYPHEFSGGQRQRIAIARALGPQPRLVVADEPVSALDVTIQAQILDLMRELQEELGLTYVFVSHDLGVIRQVSDQVAVMRAGRVVEFGSAEEVCTAPSDAYTQRLLAAVPKLAV